MGTDLSESRRDRCVERHWGDSPLRKSTKGDYSEAYDNENIKYQGKSSNRDKSRSLREDKDHRSRDKDRKTKDGLKGRGKDLKDSGKDGTSRKRERKEGIEEQGKKNTKDNGREKDLDRGKQRRNVHDRNVKDQEGKQDLDRDQDDHHDRAKDANKLEEKINFERQKAKQRLKILDEQDNVDDVDNDDEGFTRTKGAMDALAGVKVLHGLDKVLEGGSVVLTLKDQEVLAGGDVNENTDILENVEIGEKCRNKAYKTEKKNAGIYDEKFNDQTGEDKKMLPHYHHPTEEEGMTLDVAGRFIADKNIEGLRRKLHIPSHNNQVEDLNSCLRISSYYYTPVEMLQFKKPKKMKSLRRREKLDIDALEAEARAEGLGSSDLRSHCDSKIQIAEKEEEKANAKRRSSAYQAAFAKADEASSALLMDQTLFTFKKEDGADFFAEDVEDLQKSLEIARNLALKKQTEKASIGPEAIAALALSRQSFDAQNSDLENKVVFTEMEEFVWSLQLDKGISLSFIPFSLIFLYV